MSDGSEEVYNLMCTEAARLKSFKNWPYGANSICSAAKMAEAGFFHCPTANEPDLVQCYVCFKELDGWEENDEPWAEHFSHSKVCLFAKIRKPQKDQTCEEVFLIEAERKKRETRRVMAQKLLEFRAECSQLQDCINSFYSNIEAKRKKK